MGPAGGLQRASESISLRPNPRQDPTAREDVASPSKRMCLEANASLDQRAARESMAPTSSDRRLPSG